MKNHQSKLFVVILLVTQLFYSCNSDDEPGFSSIIGTWRMTDMNYEGESKVDFQGVPITTTFDGIGKNIDVTMTFAESPNSYVTSGSYDVDLTYSALGQSETETIAIDNFEAGGAWSLSGNELTIDGDLFNLSFAGDTGADQTGSGTMIIEELNDTSLKLTVETTENFTQDGVDVTATVSSRLEFTRE